MTCGEANCWPHHLMPQEGDKVMRGFLTEFGKILNATPPAVVNGAAATALYATFRNWQRCSIIITIGNRAGATTPNITLTQATSSAGAGAKTLSFDEVVNSTGQSQSADSFAQVAVSSDATPLSATDNSVHVINIRDTMLDMANGFKWFTVGVATPGANDVPLSIVYVFYDGDYSGRPATMPSVVA